MARLSEEISQRILVNYRELANLINAAKNAEYMLFTRYGETEETSTGLEQLQNVADSARNNYQRLTTIVLSFTTMQPRADNRTESMLVEIINGIEAQTPAFIRSIEEVIIEWRL
jgi:S-adenosylhomocysteine hydrolase